MTAERRTVGPRPFLGLVADNEGTFARDACDLLRERLQDTGVDVHFTSRDDYPGAKHELGQHGYHLAVLDMMWPPLGRPNVPEPHRDRFGLDLVKAARGARVPVVVGYSRNTQDLEELRAEALRNGAQLFFHHDELFSAAYRAGPAVQRIAEHLRGLAAGAATGPPVDRTGKDPRDTRAVAVVHGRDERCRRSLFDLLRALGLHPVEWERAVAWTGTGAPSITQVLEELFVSTQAVVVMVTPDEEVRLRPHLAGGDDEHGLQARPNVYLEAGMALALHPQRTVLVEVGLTRPVSDLAGLHTIRLDNSAPRRQALADRLRTAGCPVDIEGNRDWYEAGNFEL